MEDDLRFVCLRKVAYASKRDAHDQMKRWQKWQQRRPEGPSLPRHFTASVGIPRVYKCPYAGFDSLHPRTRARHWHFGHVLPEKEADDGDTPHPR